MNILVIQHQTRGFIRKFIVASSNEGDTILDPFCGSGTTLVVAKRLGRRYIGIDINKKAIDITKERLSAIPERLFNYVLSILTFLVIFNILLL